jgi:hypothetical protein
MRLTNILSESNYSTVLQELLNSPIGTACDTQAELTQVVKIFFSKALTDGPFAQLYGKLCADVYRHVWPENSNGFGSRLRRELLNQCQEEHGRSLALEKDLSQFPLEMREESRDANRRRAFSNIRFVCVLYQNRVVTWKVIKQIMGGLVQPDVSNEALEMLCEMLSVIGLDIIQLDGEFVTHCLRAAVQIAQKGSSPLRVRVKVQNEIDRLAVRGLNALDVPSPRIETLPAPVSACSPSAQNRTSDNSEKCSKEITFLLQNGAHTEDIIHEFNNLQQMVDRCVVLRSVIQDVCVVSSHEVARDALGLVLSALYEVSPPSPLVSPPSSLVRNCLTEVVREWIETDLMIDVPKLWTRWIQVTMGIQNTELRGCMQRIPSDLLPRNAQTIYQTDLKRVTRIYPP